MKFKNKAALIIPFLLTPMASVPATPVHAGGVTLEKPNLHINSKGKVDVKDSDGVVRSKASLMTKLIKKYRVIIAGISGVGAVSMILFFILGFIRLGATSANPEARSKTIIGLICTGIGAAGLGAAALITGVFMNSL